MAHMLHRLRRLSHKMCGAPNLIRFRSDNVVPTQRAVAIRALGWRLRVEVKTGFIPPFNRWVTKNPQS